MKSHNRRGTAGAGDASCRARDLRLGGLDLTLPCLAALAPARLRARLPRILMAVINHGRPNGTPFLQSGQDPLQQLESSSIIYPPFTPNSNRDPLVLKGEARSLPLPRSNRILKVQARDGVAGWHLPKSIRLTCRLLPQWDSEDSSHPACFQTTPLLLSVH